MIVITNYSGIPKNFNVTNVITTLYRNTAVGLLLDANQKKYRWSDFALSKLRDVPSFTAGVMAQQLMFDNGYSLLEWRYQLGGD